jgi:DNA repair exonuclease SbcCD ATPase subunit
MKSALFVIVIVLTLCGCRNDEPTPEELESDIDELRDELGKLKNDLEDIQEELEDIKRGDNDIVPLFGARPPQGPDALEILRRRDQSKVKQLESERIENQEWYRREREIAQNVREYMNLQRRADIYRKLGDCQGLVELEEQMDSIRLEVPAGLLPERIPSPCR